jgi:hypothetical protein
MSIRVTVTVVEDDPESAAGVLRTIAGQLEEGFTTGFDRREGAHYLYEVTDEAEEPAR